MSILQTYFSFVILSVFCVSCNPVAVNDNASVTKKPIKKRNAVISSGEMAEKKLLGEVYSEGGKTFYCGAPLNAAGLGRLVPLREFKPSFREWRKTRRECHDSREVALECQKKMDREYQDMEFDLYNLVPVEKEMALLRPKYDFGVITKSVEKEECGVKFAGKILQPPERVRGDIARAYFYMDRAYPSMSMRPKQKRLMEEWDRSDPVSKEECRRCEKIEKIQGNSNPFVKKPCGKAGL